MKAPSIIYSYCKYKRNLDIRPEDKGLTHAQSLLIYSYYFNSLWRIYASMNESTTRSDNGLPPVRRQAII